MKKIEKAGLISRIPRWLIWTLAIVALSIGSRWVVAPWPSGGLFWPVSWRSPSERTTIAELSIIGRHAEQRFWYYDGIGNRDQAAIGIHEAIMFYSGIVIGHRDRSKLPALLNLFAYARKNGYADAQTAVGFDRTRQIRIFMTRILPHLRPNKTLEKYQEHVLWLENQSGHEMTYQHLNITMTLSGFRQTHNVLNFPDEPMLQARLGFQPTVYQQLVAKDGEERKKIVWFRASDAPILWMTVDAGPDGPIVIPFLQNLYHHPCAHPKSVTEEPELPE
ncbi:MAG: hypothetical protein ACREJQ_03925 [bacterium]